MLSFRKSLAFRLLIASFILLAFPLLIDSFIIVQKTYKDALRDAKSYLLEVSQARTIPLSHLQPVRAPLLIIFENILKLNETFPEKPDASLNKKLEEFAKAGEFYGVYFLRITKDDDYIVIGSNRAQYMGQSFTNLFDLIEVFAPDSVRNGYFSYLSYDKDTLELHYLVGRVVYNKETNTPTGVVVVTKDITQEVDNLLIPDTDRYQVNFALLLPSSVVIAAGEKALEFNFFEPISEYRKNLIYQTEPFAKLLLTKESLPVSYAIGFPFFEFMWEGQKQIAYVQRIPNTNISLLSYAAREAIFQEPLFKFLDIYGIYALILVIGGSLAYLFTYRMARPMRELTRVMGKLGQGDLSARYTDDFLGFEINKLGGFFNEMVESLLQKRHLVEDERIAKETYAKELIIGREVQFSLLPQKMPHYSGVSMAAIYAPAKEVGGDFYDVLVKHHSDGDTLILVIADASGKGVSACLYSLGVKSSLRIFAQKEKNACHIIEKTNHLFVQDTGDTGMFITAFVACYDRKNKELSYCSAGHNPAIIRRNDGTVELLEHGGMAMGLCEDVEHKHCTLFVNEGDLIAFYTDGITEAHNEAFEQYGEERLKIFLQKHGAEDPHNVAQELVADVNTFCGKAPQHDDITLLLMKIGEAS